MRRAPKVGSRPEGGAENKVSSSTGEASGVSVAARESLGTAALVSKERMALKREIAATLGAAEAGKAVSAADDAAEAAEVF